MELQLTGPVPLCLNDLEQMALNGCASGLLPLRPPGLTVGDALSPVLPTLPPDCVQPRTSALPARVELPANVTPAEPLSRAL